MTLARRSHDFYCEANRALFEKNKIDLASLGHQNMASIQNASPCSVVQSTTWEALPLKKILGHGQLTLGDGFPWALFTGTLRSLVTPIRLHIVSIFLERGIWPSFDNILALHRALGSIKVLKQLTLHGLDLHFCTAIRTLVSSFSMNTVPVDFEVPIRGVDRLL